MPEKDHTPSPRSSTCVHANTPFTQSHSIHPFLPQNFKSPKTHPHLRAAFHSMFDPLPSSFVILLFTQPPHPCSGMRSACPSFRGTLLHICDRSIDPPLGFPPAPTTPHPVTSPPERCYWPSVAELVHSRSAQLVKRAVLIAALIAARARTSLPLHLWRFCDGL